MRRKAWIFFTIAVSAGLLVPMAALAQDGGPPRPTPAPIDGEVVVDERDSRQTPGHAAIVVNLNLPGLVDVAPRQRIRHAATIADRQNEIAAQIEALGGAVLFRYRNLSSGMAVYIDASKAPEVSGLAGVTSVRRLNRYKVDVSNGVPLYGEAQAQALGFDGKGVSVAVLDDGIDYTHLKLGGSGLVDDYTIAAADPVNLAPSTLFPNAKVAGGYDFTGSTWPITAEEPDPDPIARRFHGTHVADILAGLPGGGAGPGVAPGALLYAFKVCSEISPECSGAAILAGLDAAADLDNDPSNGLQPADVINLSFSAAYGQPEDDVTFFVNQAVKAGAIVVASAGDGSNKPYVVGSPSTATGAISVAETGLPSDRQYAIRINAPVTGTIANTAYQRWSAPLSGAISGDVVHDTANADTRLGCAVDPRDPNPSLPTMFVNPWKPGQHAGAILLVDRGVCPASIKAAFAGEAGARLMILANSQAGAPFSFAYGGGAVTIPALMVTQADGTRLKTPGTNITLDPNDPALVFDLRDTVTGTSSRGPRNHDGYIKPDISAPGGTRSAEFGTGVGTMPFGGASGATPMVSGAAALLVQKYRHTPLPELWQHEFGRRMPVFMYKSLLMNTSNPMVYEDVSGGALAPITRIGAGQVDALAATASETIAWDETDHWIDSRFRTGSMSFGYQPVSGRYSSVRHGVIANLSSEGRWYDLSVWFRYPDDENRGVRLRVYPRRLYVPAHGYKPFFVKLRVNAQDLRPWSLNKGFLGNNGGLLTTQEYDGYILINGGENNFVHLPWQILPKRAAAVRSMRHRLTFSPGAVTRTLTLRNSAGFQDGDVDVFALLEKSPNVYYYRVLDDIIGACTSAGLPSGCNETVIDIKEVGIRDFGADTPTTTDDLIQFAATIWDSPYRAGQYPVEFDVYVNSDEDELADYRIFNADRALTGNDGRNVVFVCPLPATTCRAFFFTDSDFNTQNWILTVPASAIGVEPGEKFAFQVLAFDAYFTGNLTDCSPDDCAAYHTYTPGKPKYAVDDVFPVVPANGRLDLTVRRVPGGGAASPSQIGLLLLYRQARLERESDSVRISSPASSDPIGVENDQGCFDSAVNELWILGEIANRTAEHYDVNNIDVQVFDASGPITATLDTFEMPGIFAVPAHGKQPFYLIVILEQPTYTRYALTIDAAPGPHTFRSDLTVQFTGTTPDDGDILVNGTWTNPGPKLDYASPYATAYTAGRVSNMGYEYRSNVITGTYTYQIKLPANPCPAGSIVVDIIGE